MTRDGGWDARNAEKIRCAEAAEEKMTAETPGRGGGGLLVNMFMPPILGSLLPAEWGDICYDWMKCALAGRDEMICATIRWYIRRWVGVEGSQLERSQRALRIPPVTTFFPQQLSSMRIRLRRKKSGDLRGRLHRTMDNVKAYFSILTLSSRYPADFSPHKFHTNDGQVSELEPVLLLSLLLNSFSMLEGVCLLPPKKPRNLIPMSTKKGL